MHYYKCHSGVTVLILDWTHLAKLSGVNKTIYLSINNYFPDLLSGIYHKEKPNSKGMITTIVNKVLLIEQFSNIQ